LGEVAWLAGVDAPSTVSRSLPEVLNSTHPSVGAVNAYQTEPPVPQVESSAARVAPWVPMVSANGMY
jgi:hypothetical protein